MFKTYLDLRAWEHVSIKIFLRSDIWQRITSRGFREASHIIRKTVIRWDKMSLKNLVIRRAIQSSELLEYCGLDADAALGNRQEDMLACLLPPDKFGWILSRTADGTGQNAPRELIHFLNVTRADELHRLELGSVEGNVRSLLSDDAIKNALPEVSQVRLEQTLLAENPELKTYVDLLRQEKTSQRPASLSRIWGFSEPDATRVADILVDVGFFQKRGSKDAPQYRVPLLYRPALAMIQGTAE